MMTAHKAWTSAAVTVALALLARFTGLIEAPAPTNVLQALVELGGYLVAGGASYLMTWLVPNQTKAVLAVLLTVGLTLSACGAVQVAVPESPRQALAAAEATYAGLLEAATSARRAGLLSGDQVAAIDRIMPVVSASLDAARQLLALGEVAAALARVGEAHDALGRMGHVLPAPVRPASTAPPVLPAWRGRVMGVAHA